MSLLYDRCPKTGDFIIIEHNYSANATRTKMVTYRADLSEKRVNQDPWQSLTQADRDWFEKYYQPKFDNLKSLKDSIKTVPSI